jgi:hypothetical protein
MYVIVDTSSSLLPLQYTSKSRSGRKLRSFKDPPVLRTARVLDQGPGGGLSSSSATKREAAESQMGIPLWSLGD